MSDASKNAPSRAEVEFLAYQLFLQRGGEPGGDLADWLAAEEQLKTQCECENPASHETAAAADPMHRKAAGA